MVGDGFKIYFCDGFFAGRSHTLDSILLSGWMLCSFYNVMWIAIQFVYRYTIVCLQHESVTLLALAGRPNMTIGLVLKSQSASYDGWRRRPLFGGRLERGSR